MTASAQSSRRALAAKEAPDSRLLDIAADIFAPALYAYVGWVLESARQKGIYRLYFLARDGYAMHQMAKRLCAAKGIAIECRYLYASRIAWRTPSYHIIGDEAYALLFKGGYHITPRVILSRIGLSPLERAQVYESAGLTDWDEDAFLPVARLSVFARRVKSSPVFCALLRQKSTDAYANAIGYFRQEGLLDGEPVALVDTGWTGSMQRTLRQLLRNEGCNAPITGFYFGMYNAPRAPEDGAYEAWCFTHRSKAFEVVKYNNNVLECMCVCPYPMTMGYIREGGRYAPLFGANAEGTPERTERLLRVYNDYTGAALRGEIRPPQTAGTTGIQKRLRDLMYKPTREEAGAFCRFTFCDDLAEVTLTPLVQAASARQIREYSLLRRLWRKCFNRAKEGAPDLFWPYGSLALSGIKARAWYRLNMLGWDGLRRLAQSARSSLRRLILLE